MPLGVLDVPVTPRELIAHAVEVLGRAKQRIAIFRAIYSGKKRVKSVNEIAIATGLDRIRVLQEGRRLADNGIVTQNRAAGMIGYEKVPFYSARKSEILRLVQDPVARARIPTEAHPRATLEKVVTIRIHPSRIRARSITVDDIDSFGRVKKVRVEPGDYTAVAEQQFKDGVARILGEGGHFQDWGGERNDLYTTRVRISRRRHPAAFAFKGPGTKGILTPGRMGKNGDQIQRLFKTPANVFIVQYWGQVDESVVEQMEEFAKAKSAADDNIVFYGIIDGDDSNRLLKAYPGMFAPPAIPRRAARAR